MRTTTADSVATTEQPCSGDWSHFQKNIPVVVVFSMFVVIGVVGNSLILYIYGFRFKVTTTRVFILALAVFDLITCVTLPYKIILLRYGELFKDDNLARLEIFRLYFLQVSGMILPLVSIDRYRRICTPHKKQISPKLAKLLVLGVSIVTGAINIFRMVLSKGKCYRAEALISPDYIKYENSWINEFYFVYVVLPFIIPLPILIVMYTLVGLKVRSLSRRSVVNPPRCRFQDQPRETPPGSLRSPRGQNERTPECLTLKNIEFDVDDGHDINRKSRSDADMSEHRNEGCVSGANGQSTCNGFAVNVIVKAGDGGNDNLRTKSHLFGGSFERNLSIEDNAGPWRRYSCGHDMRVRESLSRSTVQAWAEMSNSVLPDRTNDDIFERPMSADDRSFVGEAELQPSPVASPESHASPSIHVPQTDQILPAGGATSHGNSVTEVRVPWKRMTIIFFLITVIYIISCIPFFTIYMIFRVDHNYGHNLLTQGRYIVLYDMVYITVVSNCFLYGFFDPRFQRELRSLKTKFGKGMFRKYKLCDGDVEAAQ